MHFSLIPPSMDPHSPPERHRAGPAEHAGHAVPLVSPSQQQALLDFAASQTSVIFYIADLTGASPLRFISTNVEAMTGHAVRSFLREADYGRRQIHPDDLPDYERCIEAVKEHGVATQEYRFRNRDGDYRWFRDELRITWGEDDADGTCVGCMIDITGRVQAEEQSRRLARLLRGAVETIPNGFGIYDSDERLILCNDAFAALFEGRPSALTGGSWIDHTRCLLRQVKRFDGKRIGDVDAALAGALARAREAEREPIEIQLRSGRWLQITSHPLADGGHVDVRTDITRLKQAEAALLESEARIRSVLEACPMPIRMWNPETGQVIYDSPASRTLLGRHSATPTKEDRLSIYVDLADRERYLRRIDRDGAVDSMEMQLRRTDSSPFWAAVSARKVCYGGESVIVSVIQDLTDQKAREAEIRLARETLEDAIDSLSEGLALYDAEDRLVLCNAQYKRFHGGSEDLLVPGKTWAEITRERAETGLFPQAQGRGEAWLREQIAQRGKSDTVTFPFAEDRWFERSRRATRQGGLVSTWRDITARKKMEQDLRRSDELVRQVLEACPVVLTMNRLEDGVILYESPATQALLGYDRSQVGRSVIGRWVNLEDRKAYIARLRRHRAVNGLEARYRKADGEVFWCALSSRLIDYRGEEVVVSNLFDLTDRRAAEAELSRQTEILYQSEKLSALGELLTGVSHELNNPLSVLVGQALMLQEEAPDDKASHRADKIAKAADRCAGIVKSFLAMARQDAAEMAPVDLTSVIDCALEVTAYSLHTSGIEVSRRIAKGQATVLADADQMRQVFTNLIVNAKDALQAVDGPRKLRITTSYRKHGEQLVIKVKDNGPGIPADIRTRIFEPLYTTKEVGSGTGIGLALCHRIVEAHGGTIAIEGGPGEGAVFVIRLPCTLRCEQPTTEMPRAPAQVAKCRVLVIDDEYDVGQIILDVLEHDGHAVDLAGSGDLALQKIERRHYDVVLSDIRMPGMDGPSFYRALCAARPDLVAGLAFVTGDTLSPQAKEFLDATGRPYLEKPLRPRDLRELVDLLMRGKAA